MLELGSPDGEPLDHPILVSILRFILQLTSNNRHSTHLSHKIQTKKNNQIPVQSKVDVTGSDISTKLKVNVSESQGLCQIIDLKPMPNPTENTTVDNTLWYRVYLPLAINSSTTARTATATTCHIVAPAPSDNIVATATTTGAFTEVAPAPAANTDTTATAKSAATATATGPSVKVAPAQAADTDTTATATGASVSVVNTNRSVVMDAKVATVDVKKVDSDIVKMLGCADSPLNFVEAIVLMKDIETRCKTGSYCPTLVSHGFSGTQYHIVLDLFPGDSKDSQFRVFIPIAVSYHSPTIGCYNRKSFSYFTKSKPALPMSHAIGNKTHRGPAPPSEFVH